MSGSGSTPVPGANAGFDEAYLPASLLGDDTPSGNSPESGSPPRWGLWRPTSSRLAPEGGAGAGAAERSSSAPPAGDAPGQPARASSGVDDEAYRSTAEYAKYYYSQKPLDPRLAKPVGPNAQLFGGSWGTENAAAAAADPLEQLRQHTPSPVAVGGPTAAPAAQPPPPAAQPPPPGWQGGVAQASPYAAMYSFNQAGGAAADPMAQMQQQMQGMTMEGQGGYGQAEAPVITPEAMAAAAAAAAQMQQMAMQQQGMPGQGMPGVMQPAAAAQYFAYMASIGMAPQMLMAAAAGMQQGNPMMGNPIVQGGDFGAQQAAMQAQMYNQYGDQGGYGEQSWDGGKGRMQGRQPQGSRQRGGRGGRGGGRATRSSRGEEELSGARRLVRGPFLEEFRNNKTKDYTLPEVVGHFVEFSLDQHGSRWLQQQLEIASGPEMILLVSEVLPSAVELTTDAFGNYVIQKLFEHGALDVQHQLVAELSGQMQQLSLHTYGCRVVQKALECTTNQLQADIATELANGSDQEVEALVMRCVRDQNGNHVIQKCIECVPEGHIEFIVKTFYGKACQLATHPYGCRVVQRVLERCSDNLKKPLLDEVIAASTTLAQNQYANYVIQHILSQGTTAQRESVVTSLRGNAVHMCQHKFASNVVEKALIHGTTSQRSSIIKEILTTNYEPSTPLPKGRKFHPRLGALGALVQDPYGNYVIQKVCEVGSDAERRALMDIVRRDISTFRSLTYGKHILDKMADLT